VYANKKFAELHGYTVQELLNTNYFDLFDPTEKERIGELNSKMLEQKDAPRHYEAKRIRKDDKALWCGTVAVGIAYQDKPAVMGNIVDISQRKQAEEQQDKLISDLQKALAKVKALSGLLPICANCKKIRDDDGYWNQIESYIHDHSEAEFSHSICPDCAKKLYPDLYNDDA
jgi:PAS domain S-box-containing protein